MLRLRPGPPRGPARRPDRAARAASGRAAGSRQTRSGPRCRRAPRRASQKALPSSYWASFRSSPSSRSTTRSGAERVLAAAFHGGAQRRRGPGSGARRASPSRAPSGPRSTAMAACSFAITPRCSRVWISAASPPSRKRLHEPARVRQRRQPAGGAAVDPHLHRLEVLAHERRHVLAQPGHALELEDVRELVRADPALERARAPRPSRTPPALRLGATNSSRAGRSPARSETLVLAEHPVRDVAHHEAGLRGHRGRGAHAQGARERAGERRAGRRAARPPGRAARRASRGWPTPTPSGSRARAPARARPARGPCTPAPGPRARRRPRPRSTLVGGGVVGARGQVRDLPGERPVDHRAERYSSGKLLL